jgi:hypothetical protein
MKTKSFGIVLVVLGIFTLFTSVAVAGSLDYPYKERYRFVRSTWTAGETFYRNDLANWNGILYRSLQNGNANRQPDISPTWWVATSSANNTTPADWWRSEWYYSGEHVLWNGHEYASIQVPNQGNQPDTSPTYWQDLGAKTNPFDFRAWGNLEFFEPAQPLDQWFFGGGASVVGAGMLKAESHQNHWAEQETDNSGVGQYGLGPTVRMIDSNNFYKLCAVGLDPYYPWFAFQLWRVRNGTYTLLYQTPYNDAVGAYAALKLGVSNDSNGNPVLEMAYRAHGYDPYELAIGSYPWVYINSYTDVSADAIKSGGKPGTWGYYPATEGTSHWSYGEYVPSPPVIIHDKLGGYPPNYPDGIALTSDPGWAAIPGRAVPVIQSTLDAAGYGAGVRGIVSSGSIRRTEDFGNDQYAEISQGPPANYNDQPSASGLNSAGVAVRMDSSTDSCYYANVIYSNYPDAPEAHARLVLRRINNGVAATIANVDVPYYHRDDWWFFQLKVWGQNPVNLALIAKAPSEWIPTGSFANELPDFNYSQYLIDGQICSHDFTNRWGLDPTHQGYFYDCEPYAAAKFTSPPMDDTDRAWVVWTGTDSSASRLLSGYPGLYWYNSGWNQATNFTAGKLNTDGTYPDYVPTAPGTTITSSPADLSSSSSASTAAPEVITYTIIASAGTGGSVSPGTITLNSGSNQTYTITPAAGYHIADVLVDGISQGPVTMYPFSSINADHAISATFAANPSYTITAAAEVNGTITPSGTVTVNPGDNGAFSITPNPGYQVSGVIVDGAQKGALTSYIFTNVSANHAISAYFKLMTFTLTASATSGGSISPAGTITLNIGSNQTYTITPTVGYYTVDVQVDGLSQGAVAAYTFTNVTANHTIAATFAANPSYTIIASAGPNGSISPSDNVSVLSGANQNFTFTPAAGYRVADVLVDGASVGARTSYTFTNVAGPHTISASFTLDVYSITAAADVNGTITPSGPITVHKGASQTFTITPDPGYQVRSVIVDGANRGAITTYTFTNVTANHTINAYFKVIIYTITASAGTGGSISPGTSILNIGASQTYTMTPTAGYHMADVLVDGASVGAVTAYAFSSINANHTISATFAANPAYTITASAGPNGTISPSGVSTVLGGTSQTYSITPLAGCHIADVLVDGASVGAVTTYTLGSINANHTISVTFAASLTYTITASAGPNGSISPSDNVSVPGGANQKFTFTPAAGYRVADVLVDGASVGARTSYTFYNVQTAHTISASFTLDVYSITAAADVNGTITPSGPITVHKGASQTYTITPAAGHQARSVIVDGANKGAIASYTFTNIAANHTINAYFKVITYTITASAGAGGSISPSGTAFVNIGTSRTYTITPTAGYHIMDVLVDGASVGAVTTYAFTDVASNHAISATFEANPSYSITVSAGANGVVSPGTVTVLGGTSRKFTITPDTGYRVADVQVDGVSVGARTSYTFYNVQGGHTINASFTLNVYTITASADVNGSITPSGTITVNKGASQTYTITPAAGHQVRSVIVDGANKGAVTSFTFTNITANHTINVYFK